MQRNHSSAMSPKSRHGRLLADRYQLLELIGSGAMGQVYRAEDKLLGGVTVAVKFLSQSVLSNRTRERFEQEATISALLGQNSIHIVGVRDYGVDGNDVPFYVMEYLEGESLSEIIRFHPLPLSRFLRLVRQICFGLESAHKGIFRGGEVCSIIHRDIKPGNIFVIQDAGFGELVKILDFGIAKLIFSGESKTQSFMGTLAYCSPEQIEGKELDSRSDIYSFGVLMYELITGDMPLMPENTSFGGWYEVHHHYPPKPFPSNLNLPRELTDLILQCLEKKREERPQNAGEILQVLTNLEKQSTSESNLEKQSTSESNKVKKKLPSLERLGKYSSWPADKPQQKIVFPQILRAYEGIFASVWMMLDQGDMASYRMSKRYNHFIFMPDPHPMLLWLSVLYVKDKEPRWLPCYLDMKTPIGQKLAHLLAKQGRYWLLFFTLDNPQRCQKMTSVAIATQQRPILIDWCKKSRTLPSSKPQITKKLLKQDLERLKPSILTKLEGI